MKKLSLVVLALWPALVQAQAFRAGSGVQTVPQSTAPSKGSANAAIYYNSSDSKYHYVTPSGTDSAFSSGAVSGTVTSVGCGTGLSCSPSPITSTGTMSISPAGPGAATYCGGSQYVLSVTLNASGQTTAVTCGTPAGGGGGTIGGSIAANQIPIGSGTNTVSGSTAVQWDSTEDAFVVTNNGGICNPASAGAASCGNEAVSVGSSGVVVDDLDAHGIYLQSGSGVYFASATVNKLNFYTSTTVPAIISGTGLGLIIKGLLASGSASSGTLQLGSNVTLSGASDALVAFMNNTTAKMLVLANGILQFVSTAASPSAAGQIAWDGTNLKYSTNGTSWTNFGSGGGGASFPLSDSTAGNYASTVTPRLTMSNTTAATSGQGQNSPSLHLGGRSWAGSDADGSWDWYVDNSTSGSPKLSAILSYNGTTGYAGANFSLVPLLHGSTATGVQMNFGGAGSGYISSDATTNQLLLHQDGSGTLNFYGGVWGPVTAYSAYTRGWYDVEAYSHRTTAGAQLTAAATITPTTGRHHVTGATTITTIAATNFGDGAQLMLISDSTTVSFGTGGNIAIAGTIALNKMQLFVWDSTAAKWFPQS